MTRLEKDVVIVGAGLAGLQCARSLGASGLGVLLADRKSDLSKGVHTTGIFVRKTFEDFAFPPGVLGPPIRKVTLYSPKLRPLALTSDADEFRVGKMGKLYEALLSECTAAGVEFSGETRFISTESSGSRTKVVLEKNGSRREINAAVIVGADGANSAVAASLGLDRNREMIVGFEEVYRRSIPHEEPELRCFLDSRLAPGYLAWVADDGHEMHVGVGGYAESFKPREALESFKAKIANDLFDLKESRLVETRGGRIPVGGVLKRISNRNGLVIGDAAGAVSPLTAGGLDPCIRLSAFAADVIRRRLASDDPAVLLEYSGKVFRGRFISRLWMRRAMAMFRNQELLELACTLLRSRAGRHFAKHVFFGRGSFPEVPIGRSASPSLDMLLP